MKKPRLLIIGCGDVVRRALPWLMQHFTVYATARSKESASQLNTLGVRPILADLDRPKSLARLGGIAEYLIHSAPPGDGAGDQRTRALIAALSHANIQQNKILPQRLRRAVYISTSGVYGDYAGQWIDESSPLKTQSQRALRRVDAEKQLRDWAGRHGVRLSILRSPGIYAANRLPLERIARGEPVLHSDEDS